MWIARHEDSNKLCLWTDEKPVRRTRYASNWSYWYGTNGWEGLELDSSLFPELTWKDGPIEVDICPKTEKYQTVKVEILDELYRIKAEYEKIISNK